MAQHNIYQRPAGTLWQQKVLSPLPSLRPPTSLTDTPRWSNPGSAAHSETFLIPSHGEGCPNGLLPFLPPLLGSARFFKGLCPIVCSLSPVIRFPNRTATFQLSGPPSPQPNASRPPVDCCVVNPRRCLSPDHRASLLPRLPHCPRPAHLPLKPRPRVPRQRAPLPSARAPWPRPRPRPRWAVPAVRFAGPEETPRRFCYQGGDGGGWPGAQTGRGALRLRDTLRLVPVRRRVAAGQPPGSGPREHQARGGLQP